MARGGSALEALIAGLRGRPVAAADWHSVIALANHTLLTPALFAALAHSGEADRLPRDVAEYLRFIYDCNRERNRRLSTQLGEVVAALNRRGIVPLLLKGAVPLFLSPAGQVPNRITSDLDLGVEAAEEAAARACVRQLGYVEAAVGREMAPPRGGAILDLRPYTADGADAPEAVARHRRRVKIPSAQSRALHWMLHDLLKEGDYWRGRVDLRHLHDLAQLDDSDRVDWAAVRLSTPAGTARNAVDTQLLALHHFFVIEIPPECARSPLVRFQNWRRVFTATSPVMGAPLRLVGNAAWAARRLSNVGDVARRGPRDLLRRAARAVSEPRSKI